MNRIGIGYDLHVFAEGRLLILGGIEIPHERGLKGHSDADALTHAVIDAMLGAAARGNIGQLFPDTDARYKDANSLSLLAEATSIISEAGYRVVNVDANIIAEKPRMSPFLDAMSRCMAGVLGVEPSRVSVKAKTNEGVGPEGRGDAISTQAVVLLERVESR